MTKPAVLRAELLKLLPLFSARSWVHPYAIRARRPDLKGVHPALANMVKTGHAARRKDESTGLFVYARAKRRNGVER